MQVLRKLLFPLSWIYGMVVWIRNWCYDIGLFGSTHFDLPIICIGNLSLGGTGKTPMTEYLLHMLLRKFKVGVLSRGYKRTSSGYVLANKTSTVDELGDEPYQMFLKFPEMHLALNANRVAGIQKLRTDVNPDVILLDDAFQHRKVNAGLYILLTTYGDLFSKDFYVPTGNLRDHKNQARRAHIIVVTKCPPVLSKTEKNKVEKQVRQSPDQLVLFASLRYDSWVESPKKRIALEEFVKTPFVLVTGIANPKPLVAFLESIGARFRHEIFPDHHAFSHSEIQKLSRCDTILTTEKDMVRLVGKVNNIYCIGIKHDFEEDTALFTRKITDFVGKSIAKN